MEGGEPPAKKRGSERQISQLDPESDGEDEEPKGPFAKASEDVLKTRKIISVKRKAGGAGSGGPNPFSGVSLFGSTAAKPAEGEAKEGSAAATTSSAPLFGSFGAAAKTNPFAFAAAASSTASGFSSFVASAAQSGGLAGGSSPATTEATGATTPAAATEGAASAAAFSFSTTPASTEGNRFPSVQSVFGSSAAPAPSIFGSTALASSAPALGSTGTKTASPSVLSDEKQVTGEEEEAKGFAAEATLYEFDDNKTWKERGKGEMRVNLAASGQARFVMRQRGNLRLLMNANLWSGINIAIMDGGKGVTFAVVNAAAGVEEEEGGKPKEAETKLGTYAVRFKSKDHVSEFMAVVEANKSNGQKEANGEDATPGKNVGTVENKEGVETPAVEKGQEGTATEEKDKEETTAEKETPEGNAGAEKVSGEDAV
uniref:RanBD1 domain-containing protein n=1 Tax=Tetraselmis chuii TaxID=63592 RepID=A0A7S1T254_9CHLO|mmetsp:Transcript_40174/g.72135  ORF Transcript_40174/g.72135 Transcript_40174/m.72135 type:complete len:428 (+) Transcript_40174:196-1479(+)|eukprot:CAMPEP_0177779912 /NCGR_PEP_ID=MMETSP0491_2-20121128/16889_1 /TAXON_ID=63592 /ORGANISM="Tetraselmis chuii, Strain PLY429" /LENGTH=427 /DNA_ID=CAMNT_0019299581 /DNA_START=187 /DNA_END=1470 /DNA_ORIENTATION=+